MTDKPCGHPLICDDSFSPARSPALAGFIMRVGSRWGRKNINWGVSRLEHRGAPIQIVESNPLSLYSFAETPLASHRGDIQFWSMGLDQGEHDRAFNLALEGGLFARGPLDFRFGICILYDAATGQVLISRGEMYLPQCFYAAGNGSLLMAPEVKAFSDISRREEIGPIPRSHVLRFDPAKQKLELEHRIEYWPDVELTSQPYAQCQERLRTLLLEGMEHSLAQCEGEVALSLSGGLDSAIVAHLGCEVGRRLPAYTVYFDPGDGTMSDDQLGARRTAENLGLDLTEIRIGVEELDELVRKVIYRTEEPNWRDIETGTFVLKLCEEMEKRGVHSLFMGSKADTLFVSHFQEHAPPRLIRALPGSRRSDVFVGEHAGKDSAAVRPGGPFPVPPSCVD